MVLPTWVEKACYESKKRADGGVSFLSSGKMIFPRAVLDEVAGFDKSITTGEDWDICNRIRSKGLKVIYGCQLEVVHLGNMKTLSMIFMKEVWHGMGVLDLLFKGVLSKQVVVSVFLLLGFLAGLAGAFAGEFRPFFAFLFIYIFFGSLVTITMMKNVEHKSFGLFVRGFLISLVYLSGRTVSSVISIYKKLSEGHYVI